MHNVFGIHFNQDQYNDGLKNIKERCKILNTHLEGKTFVVSQHLTLADITLFNSLMGPFAVALDAGFRKAMPHVSAWFERVSRQSAVLNTCGFVRMCDKAIKPKDPASASPVELPAKADKPEAAKKEEKKKPADDDEFDPFADDEEDEEAEKEKQARFKELAKTAKSYGKAKATAKSLIVWEVKPWGEETDLDEMAKMILGIEMDGLYWKTEYKKEPIAYGVFKIIIGATIEDDKVSTDEVAEKIEAFEDHVQSVDVQSFNKL